MEGNRRLEEQAKAPANALHTSAHPTDADVHQAILVILGDKQRWTSSLNYAVNYCKAALTMQGHELKVQCLYILGNITGWRHPQAKDVRTVLKAYTKRAR